MKKSTKRNLLILAFCALIIIGYDNASALQDLLCSDSSWLEFFVSSIAMVKAFPDSYQDEVNFIEDTWESIGDLGLRCAWTLAIVSFLLGLIVMYYYQLYKKK